MGVGMTRGKPQAPDHPRARMRAWAVGRRGHVGSDGDGGISPILAELYLAHYNALVRLAALLTCSAQLADEIAADALASLLTIPMKARASSGRELYLLRREVVVRARHIVRQQRATPRLQRGRHAADIPADASQWQRSPVVRILASLPIIQREAVVLRHYLDLSEEDAAAVMGVGTRVVRRSLASGIEALGAASDWEPATD